MLIDKVKECSKCGICRSVCPVFLTVNDEVMSPRGRIGLIEAMLEGGLSISERYMDTVRSCIRCMRCSIACPSGVRVEEIVQSARDILHEYVPDYIREVFRDMMYDRGKFRNSLTHRASHRGSEIPLWFLPLFFHEKAYLPELAPESVLDKYPEYIYSGGKRRAALFIGCAINYAHTDIADSVIQVLKELGVDIFLPRDQLCCGAPLLLYGDRDGAGEIARRNMTALKAKEFDAVITLCPACGVTLKNEYRRIIGDDTKSFIYDISEFIDKYTDYNVRRMDAAVTYHDPCYLRLGQKVIAAPRRILQRTARFIEMKDADRCCGLGGTLGLFHPEISEKISEAKINAILESGADAVATGCPGCILFLKDQLAKKGVNKEVLHTVQVLHKNLVL